MHDIKLNSKYFRSKTQKEKDKKLKFGGRRLCHFSAISSRNPFEEVRITFHQVVFQYQHCFLGNLNFLIPISARTFF